MNIGPFSITKRIEPLDYTIPNDIDEQYEAALRSGKRLILGTLVARSGTRSLCEVFCAHENATGITERYAEAESFMRYVAYNNLPIDLSGVVKLIKKGILKDWKKYEVSLVFSPYFSHSIRILVDQLKVSKTIIGVAEPKFTVQSIYNKNVFSEHVWYENTDLLIGYQPQVGSKLSHFFGRVLPSGEEFGEWNQLSRIGKISWWGNRIMRDIKKQMDAMHDHEFFVFDLPQAIDNYEYYTRLQKCFNLSPKLTETQYKVAMNSTVKSGDNVQHKWTEKEESEFEEQAREWNTIYQNITKAKI